MNYQKFVKEHTDLTSKVCKVLADADISAEEGELIMAWLAGISLGLRQASMTDGKNHTLEMLAVGWQVGASQGDDDA